MATLTRAQIQALLETDDKPTQAEFVSIFLGVPNIEDDGLLSGAEDNITAHASGTIGNAYVLSKRVNHITTAAAGLSSVKLPPGIAGMPLTIWNDTANIVNVFANDGGQINKMGVDNASSIVAGDHDIFDCYAADLWAAHE